ncbi:FG-GAP repeat domain-containing protein [Candidatus Latescibacterota bacterium]
MSKKLILIIIMFISIQFSVLSLIQGQDTKPDFPQFRAHVVDKFPGGYKVAVADLNNDGRPDIIGLSTNPANLVWYENPSWEKHVITTKTKENIDLAVYDIDNDGRLDIALADEFGMSRTTAGGLLHWLKCPDNPTREWELTYIGEEPTSHRLLWADINGDGKKELVNVPIMGRGAKEPDWNVGVNLVWFDVPENPSKNRWEPQLIDNTLTVIHGASVVDWNGDRCEDILTASFEGVHVFSPNVRENMVAWKKNHIGEGYQTDAPERGASEIALGEIGSSSNRFFATIEPWHGDNVVVYTPGKERDTLWNRHVIDSTFNEGHALVCADIDNDGIDEIIAGYRGKGASLFIFRADGSDGTSWKRITLDNGDMATSGICTADINGDGYLDIIAVGTSTGNIKWYENTGIGIK